MDRLLTLARAYRGWTRAQLCERLGRGTSRVVPDSGIPKLDLIVRIADALDWGLGDVAEELWLEELGERAATCADEAWSDAPYAERQGSALDAYVDGRDGGAGSCDSSGVDPDGGASARLEADRVAATAEVMAVRSGVDHAAGLSFEELDLRAVTAHRDGDAPRLLALARRLRDIACTSTERALAANREAGAWDLRGRFVRSLEAVQRGLSETHVRDDVRLMLEVNLAHAHYSLRHLVDAKAVATELVHRFALSPPRSRLERVAECYALAIRGNTSRRQIPLELPAEGTIGMRDRAFEAQSDLERACRGYGRLAIDYHDRSYSALAATCQAGLLECGCVMGSIRADAALAQVIERLGDVEDVASVPRGDYLESYGWWALVGCTIAHRHLSGDRLQRALAICTNKAIEIAECLDNWAMREQAFAMEFARRLRAHDRVAGAEHGYRHGPCNAPCDGPCTLPSGASSACGDAARLSATRPAPTAVGIGAGRRGVSARPSKPGGELVADAIVGDDPAASAWLLDDEDVRVLAGAMGRFPAFRPVGWSILESARLTDTVIAAFPGRGSAGARAPAGGGRRSNERASPRSPAARSDAAVHVHLALAASDDSGPRSSQPRTRAAAGRRARAGPKPLGLVSDGR